MKCPYCLLDIHPSLRSINLADDAFYYWYIEQHTCSACNKSYFILGRNEKTGSDKIKFPVFPKVSGRPPCPAEVPKEYSEDYNEACLVLLDSPKASAALGRRCLQLLLRDVVGVKKSNLYDEIQEFSSMPSTPSYISKAVDAVRQIGNFAAHPIKSTKSGEIIPVEPGEAEWTLEVLESLFDFFFVQPKRLEERKAKLDEKLKEAGKKEI